MSFLISLGEISNRATSEKRIFLTGSAIEAAKQDLLHLLHADHRILEPMVASIESYIKQCEMFLLQWNDLMQSVTKLYRIKDEHMLEFYELKVGMYLNEHEVELKKQYVPICSMQEMEAFIKSLLMNALIEMKELNLAFEDELKQRFVSSEDGMDAISYLKTQLLEKGINYQIIYKSGNNRNQQ